MTSLQNVLSFITSFDELSSTRWLKIDIGFSWHSFSLDLVEEVDCLCLSG
jgi:hypothetical protein